MAMDRTRAESIAAQRKTANRWSDTNEGISRDADLLGVAGEVAFATCFGLPHDRIHAIGAKVNRDGQFVVAGERVKVQTSYTPGHLLVQTTKVRAAIYVLARMDRTTREATLIGWATKGEVLAAPVLDLSKGAYKLPSYAIPAAKLHLGMADLAARWGREIRPDGIAPAPAAEEPVQIGLGLDIKTEWGG